MNLALLALLCTALLPLLSNAINKKKKRQDNLHEIKSWKVADLRILNLGLSSFEHSGIYSWVKMDRIIVL